MQTARLEPAAKPPLSAAGLRRASGAALELVYEPAPDGADSNLLVLLHGLGDTARPFAELGRQLQRTLPQLAVVSVQAPKRVPLLDEDAYMWWDSFDMLGERTCAH